MARTPTTIRLDEDEAALFDQAADVVGVSRSRFMRETARREARRVLREHRLGALQSAEVTSIRMRTGEPVTP